MSWIRASRAATPFPDFGPATHQLQFVSLVTNHCGTVEYRTLACLFIYQDQNCKKYGSIVHLR